jgi:hypothetical protein
MALSVARRAGALKMNPSEIYANQTMKSVPGWFYDQDAISFLAIDHLQQQQGISGALAEVGVYCGKSLGLLATFRRPDERVYGFDLYTGEASLERTKDTLRRAVGDLTGVELVTADSLQMPAANLQQIMPEPVRFLHIDAGHEYHEALSDLRTFGAKVCACGVIAVDDYYDKDFPGVCAATNDFIRESGFVPFLAGLIKLYLCRAEQLESYIAGLLSLYPFQQNARLARFIGRPVLIGFSVKPQAHQQNVGDLRSFFGRTP